MNIQVTIEMPPCMKAAWELIEEDRAFVACLVTEDEIRVVSSEGTVEQIKQLPQGSQLLSPETDLDTRASFLLTGVLEVARPNAEPE